MREPQGSRFGRHTIFYIVMMHRGIACSQRDRHPTPRRADVNLSQGFGASTDYISYPWWLHGKCPRSSDHLGKYPDRMKKR